MNNINTVISEEFIKSLSPCSDRLENYLSHYSEKSFSLEKFLKLKKITWRDKFWVLWNHNFITVKQKIELSPIFAEHVLHIFEAQYSEDDRTRKAIEATKNNTVTEEIRSAAYAAYAYAAAVADAVATHAAAHAAYAAADAAAAHVYAFPSYAYTSAAHAAYAAAAHADDATTADDAIELERKYQVLLILKVLQGN